MRKIICILLFTVLVVSCKKPEQVGPDLVGIYGPVTITEAFAASTSSVSFANGGNIFFTARFKNDAVWTITITGANGAQKMIRGISKQINAENSTWIGVADVLPSFMAGSVTATLSFQNDSQTESISLTITQKRASDLETDVLVTDFLVSKVQNYGAIPIAPDRWASDFPLTINSETSYGFPDGNAYMVMGTVNNDPPDQRSVPWQGAGSPYVDILTISPRNSIKNYGTYFPLYADPTKVYFNIMVYNTGTPTWLSIVFLEDGVDARKIDIKPNWIGWKLISVKYSDLLSVDDAPFIKQPQKITDIKLVMLSNLPTTDPQLETTTVKAAFDHICFTHNKPYQP